jgi:hypothetical protein
MPFGLVIVEKTHDFVYDVSHEQRIIFIMLDVREMSMGSCPTDQTNTIEKF